MRWVFNHVCVVASCSTKDPHITLCVKGFQTRISCRYPIFSDMDNQDDPKFDFKAPEENNIRKWEPKKSDAFQGVSPFDFAMRQKNEDRKRKEGDREAKAKLYNYQSKGVATLEELNALKINAENEKVKQAARQNIEDAKKVNMAVSGFGVEQASRNADYEREKAWKEAKKQEKSAQKDYNMAAGGIGIEQASRNADYEREKAWKEAKKQEKSAQKDYNMAAGGFGIEQASRNADHEREKAYRETQKQELAKHKEFDMARALF
jgi:hypothetical protein